MLIAAYEPDDAAALGSKGLRSPARPASRPSSGAADDGLGGGLSPGGADALPSVRGLSGYGRSHWVHPSLAVQVWFSGRTQPS